METPQPTLVLRDARDGDALDLIELIGSVFGEYPNCVLDVDGEMPELRHIASYFRDEGGEFWVAERAGRILGMCGYVTVGDAGVELRKLYVHRHERKSGLGARFAGRVEQRAVLRDKRFVELWSDTKFETAHRFYERRGYLRGHTRELFDKSNTVEVYFRKELKHAATS